jgi:hypothetical protein
MDARGEPHAVAQRLEFEAKFLAQERGRLRSRSRCEKSGVPPVKAALSLGGAKLSAGERHGFENLFVLKGGLYVGALGLGAGTRGRSVLVLVFHCKPA